MQDFVNREALFVPFQGAHRVGDPPSAGITPEKFSNQLRSNRRRKSCGASTNSNNLDVSRKRFKASTPGSALEQAIGSAMIR